MASSMAQQKYYLQTMLDNGYLEVIRQKCKGIHLQSSANTQKFFLTGIPVSCEEIPQSRK